MAEPSPQYALLTSLVPETEVQTSIFVAVDICTRLSAVRLLSHPLCSGMGPAASLMKHPIPHYGVRGSHGVVYVLSHGYSIPGDAVGAVVQLSGASSVFLS